MTLVDECLALLPSTDCVVWPGYRNPHGYGALTYQRRSYLAHRFFYEHSRGSIPEGMFLDHLCRVRACVNPAHLEVVTAQENVLRGETLAARNKAKTHCAKGHPFCPENTFVTARGERACRACARESCRRNYQMRKQASA